MSGEFLELFADRETHDRVLAGVQRTIQQSFVQDKSRVTRSEVKRRFEICEGTIRLLRSDFGWAYDRIVDELPTALRAVLDGVPWDPTRMRNIWSPPSQL